MYVLYSTTQWLAYSTGWSTVNGLSLPVSERAETSTWHRVSQGSGEQRGGNLSCKRSKTTTLILLPHFLLAMTSPAFLKVSVLGSLTNVLDQEQLHNCPTALKQEKVWPPKQVLHPRVPFAVFPKKIPRESRLFPFPEYYEQREEWKPLSPLYEKWPWHRRVWPTSSPPPSVSGPWTFHLSRLLASPRETLGAKSTLRTCQTPTRTNTFGGATCVYRIT